MSDYAPTDNVFCTAILQILEIPGILTDSSPIDLDELKHDFEKNGDSDETFYGQQHKRKPLVNLQSKMNKNLSKKAQQKLAKAHKSGFCRFCENNEEPPHVYNSHSLRDNVGRLTCPRLRKYVCPICGASGDNAHTVRYCNKKPIFVITGGDSTEVKKVRASALFKKAIRIYESYDYSYM